MASSRKKTFSKDAFSKRHRRDPHIKPIVEDETTISEPVPSLEVTSNSPAPEPTAIPKVEVTPKEPPKTVMPASMRMALLSKRIDDDWRGLP